jgi:hypothetical protein
MCSLNATTPQLKVVENYLDAYCSLDIKNVEPHISKNFTYQVYPKVPNLTDGPKEQYIKKFIPVLSLVKKLDVCIRRWGTPFRLTLRTTAPSLLFTR